MNILKKSMGEVYPKLGSAVCADGNRTIATVSRTLSPDHVDLDTPGYVETKFKKSEPAAIKNIGLDCKPFLHLCNEPEEENHEDA